MRHVLFALPVLLVACATPQESCVNNASRDLRVLTGLIAETRGNLQRGFALVERQEFRTVRTTCKGENEDGSTFLFRCEKAKTVTRRLPVAIDLNAERAKLQSLEERQRQMQVNLQGAIAQCQAQFPE